MALVQAFYLLLLPLLSSACSSIDCGPGFCMVGQDGKPRCVCTLGYEGDRCEIAAVRRSAEVSPCAESPCRNGGTCVPLGSDFGSGGSESSGFSGSGELIPLGESELDCGTDGGCFTCICSSGFTGPNCITALNSCPAVKTGGFVWESTSVGGSVSKPCSSVDFSLRGTSVVRRCSLDGEWEQPDYTDCTLADGSSPFILLWLAAEGEMIELYLPQLETMLTQLLLSTSSLAEAVSQTQRMIVSNADFTIDTCVLFTYKVTFPIDAGNTDISSSFNVSLPSQVEIDQQTSITLDIQGYKGFFPSEVCSCLEPGDALLVSLCTVVNGNDQTSSCRCTGTGMLETCECQEPFYVGDGIECAVDADGDGFPNSPLSSCGGNSTESYCSADLCPQTFYFENTAFPCKADNLSSFDGCLGGEDVWGFVWPNTENEETVVVACPDGQGSATRRCVNGEWEMAQVLECESSGFVSALTEAEAIFHDNEADLSERLSETAVIMQSLLRLVQPREGLSHLPGDLNAANTITSGVLELLEKTLLPDSNISSIPPQSVFAVFNTALHPNNAQGWITLQDGKGGASKLLDSMERYGLYLSLVAPDEESRTVSQDDNFVLGVIRYSTASNSSSVTFPESPEEVRNASFSAGLTAQITIPSSLLLDRKSDGANTAPVAGSIARGMEVVLLPTELGETWSVASQVISAQVGERSVKSSTPITVLFSFNSVKNVSEFRCGYWNFSDDDNGGSWAFDGVEMSSVTDFDGTTVVTCESMHLTSFAVLVNTGDGVSDLSSTELKALMAVSYIGCAISLACLFIAIIYYITIRKELLVQVHYFIHLNLAISLFLAYLVFVFGIQLARENEGACIFVAALLQYLFLSAFCWMMCEGIMLYLMLIVVFSRLSKKWWFFMIIGWVPALVPVIIGLGARHQEYGVENDTGDLEYCWLSTNKGVVWAFIAPMLVIILINTVFLVIALFKVAQTKRRQAFKRKGATRAKANFELFKTLFRATVVLLPILGLTWVLGLFAVNQNSSWLAWLFTIFNTLQGCFILIIHVMLSDKFWKSTHIRKWRRYVSTTVRSSQIGSTVYSTIKRSSVQNQNTLTLTKYSTSGTVITDSIGPALDHDAVMEDSVIANEGSAEKTIDLEVGLSSVEATEQN